MTMDGEQTMQRLLAISLDSPKTVRLLLFLDTCSHNTSVIIIIIIIIFYFIFRC